VRANILLLPGDGIGPEVTGAAVQVLQALADAHGHSFTFQERLIGGCSIDRYGTALSDEVLADCQSADAVLLGAVGGSKWDDPRAKVRPEQGLLRLRKDLGVFANLRPVRVHPALVSASPLRPELLAPNGYLHAATIIALADTTCGYGTITALPGGAHSFTTIELKTNFLHTAREGAIACLAMRVHAGRTTQIWDAQVTDEASGKTIALFRCTQLILYSRST